MSRDRIKPSTPVSWRTYPNAPSTPLHSGEVVCFVPAGLSPGIVSRRYMQGLAWVTMTALLSQKASTRDRYLIRTGPKEWRAPAAALLERQNPVVPRG